MQHRLTFPHCKPQIIGHKQQLRAACNCTAIAQTALAGLEHPFYPPRCSHSHNPHLLTVFPRALSAVNTQEMSVFEATVHHAERTASGDQLISGFVSHVAEELIGHFLLSNDHWLDF